MSTSDPSPRYHFNPLERRGLLLGVTPGQLVTAATAGLIALWARGAVGRPAGTPIAVAISLVGLILAWLPLRGEAAFVWVLLGGGWILRRAGRTRTSAIPPSGSYHTPAGVVPGGTPDAGTAVEQTTRTGIGQALASRRKVRTSPPGISLLERPVRSGGEAVGVVGDRKTGTVGAVLAVEGPPFSLLDPIDQSGCLEGWRSVLAALGRPGSPVTRLQWLSRSTPHSSATQVGGQGADSTRVSVPYTTFISEAAPLIERHDAWLALSVSSGGATSRRVARRRDGVDVLGRELRFLEGQLRSVDLRPAGPLPLDELIDLLPGRRCEPWPLAVREGWSEVHVDDAWHRTYWVADWPRLEVGPNFLAPLLVAKASRRVSVVMAPVPPERAIRQARSARTADVADSQLRMRAGFLSNTKREREAEGAMRREAELADGHLDYRFSGYVTETADSFDALGAACAALEQAAQAARVELRCLHGRQAEAYSWTLPLCRGLR